MQPVALIEHHDLAPHVQVPAPAPLSCSKQSTLNAARDQLHRRYFAEAGAAAARFGISFSRVMEFLESRESTHGPLRPRDVRYLDDLVHAIACIDDDGRAWANLQERYDQFLIRRCAHRGGQIEAALAVGRLFVELRRHTLTRALEEPTSLWMYTGAMPLRTWLADRLSRIQSATPHATVMTSCEESHRTGTKPTVRVRTTRINLAQPIIPIGARLRGLATGTQGQAFRIGPAPAPTHPPDRGAG